MRTNDVLLARAIALTLAAFDASRSAEERRELTLEALEILAKLSNW